MSSTPETNTQHFAQVVAELGEKVPVVAATAIFNDRGVKIVEKGAFINLALYERLMQHNLSLPIGDSVRCSEVISPAAIHLCAHETLNEIAFFGRMAPDTKSRNVLLDSVSKVTLPEPIAFQLTIAQKVRPEIFRTLIRTALTAAWLAKTPLLSRFDMGMAATAGLLHDIGMLHIDPVLLQPEHQLDRNQRRQLYSHPLVSTALIDRHHQYPKEVIRAVREHHEYMDGSGYPQNLAGDEISPLGRMLSLATVVAAMFAPGRSSPELRLSVLLRMNTHRYDNTLSQQVIGLMRPATEGSSGGLTLNDDPVQSLLNIDAALKRWPASLSGDASVSLARRNEITRLGDHVAQIHRALASVGATTEQLALLGSDAIDEHLQLEMSLLAREAAWQLRTLARQTRRRFKMGQGEDFPSALQDWLSTVDTLVTHIARVEPTGASLTSPTHLAS